MDVQEELLQRFARMIDLPAFVGQRGFELAQGQEPGRLRMVHPNQWKLLKTRA